MFKLMSLIQKISQGSSFKVKKRCSARPHPKGKRSISTRPKEYNSKFDENRSLTQAQNQLLTLIEAEMHQTENGANVNWLSEQLQRDIQSALMGLMDEGLVYDTISEEYLPQTKSRVTANTSNQFRTLPYERVSVPRISSSSTRQWRSQPVQQPQYHNESKRNDRSQSTG